MTAIGKHAKNNRYRNTIQCHFFGDFAEDLNFSHSCVDASDQYFSKVIGAIEDILMDEDFINTHRGFLETHYRNIEDTEENKFVYTDIFREYSDTIEKYIQERLHLALSDFDMKRFENELKYE